MILACTPTCKTGPPSGCFSHLWSHLFNFFVCLKALGNGAIHKMAPVGVCGALLLTGACWLYGWLRAAEKNSPSESYFLLVCLNTLRVILTVSVFKELENQATERVRGRHFSIFGSMTDGKQCRTQNNGTQHCSSKAMTRTAVVGGKQHLHLSFVFLCFPHRKWFHT